MARQYGVPRWAYIYIYICLEMRIGIGRRGQGGNGIYYGYYIIYVCVIPL